MSQLIHTLMPILIPFLCVHTAIHFRKELAVAGAWIDRQILRLRSRLNAAPSPLWVIARMVAIFFATIMISSHALIAMLHVGATLVHA